MKRTPEQLRQEFWNEDLKNGALVFSQYEEIKRVLLEKDFLWVEKQYNNIKKHAIEETEFYKRYKIDDSFPVVNKSTIMDNYEAHLAKGNFALPVHKSSTSGSTGTPFTVLQDAKKRKRTIADLKVFGELCDYPSHERMVFFRIINPHINRTKEQEDKENIYYIDSSNLDDEHLQKMTDALLEKKPRIVFSYAITLVTLAKYVIAKNIDSKSFGIKTALTAGEGIAEGDRLLLEKAFGCKAYRRYSDMELGILAQDRGDGKEYHLNYGSYYFECLKMDKDEPADDGEVGRIVITDLFNKAMPMIRYDTGDLGVMERKSGEFPVLKEIYGRVRDCVYATNGSLISPAKISVSMWGSDNIKQWQFIQETQTEYTMKLNVNGKIDEEKIVKAMKSVLGEDAKIVIEYVQEIPKLSSNKQRAVICNYKK